MPTESKFAEQAAMLLRFFKALADQSRLKIVGLLADEEHSVQQLAALLQLREPTISHHLAILREAGLVQSAADGTTRWYSLNQDSLRELNRGVFDGGKLEKIARDVRA